MFYRLRDNLHYCVASGRTIILDLDGDRYLALPPGMDAAFQTAAGGAECDDVVTASLRPLLARRMLVPVPRLPECAARPAVPTACRDLAGTVFGHARVGAMAQVAIAQIAAAMRLRAFGLRSIGQRLAQQKTRIGDESQPGADLEFARIAAAFEALDPVFRRADRCLVRSLAFVVLCLSRRVAPNLVFGVQASPFSAHCWVQQGDLVLNDSLDNVRAYTPIMVV